VRENGRRAVTQYRAAESFALRPTEHQRRSTPPETLTFIQLKLEPGRTHQIIAQRSAIRSSAIGRTVVGGRRSA
jgi:23S rRNA-/tRNA-specific pseudouridylate synthase